VRFEPRPFDDPVGAALRAELEAEMIARYDGDNEPGPKPSAGDVALFLVALAEDGEPLGCGALRRLDARTAEIKRMYVRPTARGQGVGRALLTALEAAAVERGWTCVRIEAGKLQPDAVALYERVGYREIPCFGVYAESAVSLCFERLL
jgi:GNAT superfamily N-acetyltransferase